MQKNAAAYFPDYVQRFVVTRADGETTHPVVTDVAGIEYLANQNTITFHVPTTTVADFEHPDRVIIDLDPPEDAAGAAHEATWATKELLEEVGLASWPSPPAAKASTSRHRSDATWRFPKSTNSANWSPDSLLIGTRIC